MKKIITASILIGFLSGVLVAYLLSQPKGSNLSGQNIIVNTLTYTRYTASSTPTLVSSGDKQGYRIITNTGPVNAYIGVISTSTSMTSSTATGYTLLVANGGSYEIDGSNIYITGPIYAVTQSGTTTISVGQ